MIKWQSFVLAQARPEKCEQRGPLAIGVAVDQRLVCLDCGALNWTGRRTDLRAEIWPLEVAGDALHGEEIEGFVCLDWTANRSTELLAMEFLELRAVGESAGERLEPLKMKHTAVRLVRPGLADDVDDPTGRPSELGRRAARDDLKFLHRVERDIDGRALTADLFTEKPIVEIAAIQTDVVEDAALAGERDLVAVSALNDADARCKRE